MGSSGCYVWKSAINCSFGYKCENGSCVKSCSDECASGEKRCSSDTAYQTCAKNSLGCYVWGTPKSCSTGYKCSNGSCVRSCSDECTSGQKQCSSDTAYQTCVKGSLGCYIWGTPKNCSTGYKCSNGSCVSSCSDECTIGEKECSDDDSYRVCGNYDSDKCTEWGTPKNCSFGYKCQNGSCVRSCSDECTSGQKQCSSDTAYQTCVKGSLGCYIWGTPKNCSFGYKCQNGSCVSSCSDECSPGQKECSTDTAYRVCGKYDLDSCYEWSEDKECATGYNCQNGSCVKGCTDQCTLNDHQCSGTAGRTCGNYDSDSCTEWSSYEKCDDQCFYCGDGKCNSDCGETKNTCSQDCGADKPVVELAGPASVSCKGSATIGWTSDKAETCTASGAWSGTKDTSGSETIDGIMAKKTFSLACTGPGGKASDSITVDVNIVSPEANAGNDKQVEENGETGLDGSGSTAGYDNDDLVYAWTCNGGSLDNADTAEPTFNAPEVSRDTVYSCTLKVTNNCNKTDSDTVNVTVKNKISGQFSVDLSANPDSGCAPLNNVDLTAKITNLEGDKDSKYTYYFSCQGDGEWDKTITTTAATYTAKDLCDYETEGNYNAQVKVVGYTTNAEATDSANITADECGHGTFSVELTASPDSGCAPLDNVDLTARIIDIEGDKDSKYTYYFSCHGNGSWDKTITTTATSYTAKDLCDYDDEGEYQPEVKVEGLESGEEATDNAIIEVNDCGREFTVRLKAEPASGCKPVNNVDLTAVISDDNSQNFGEYTYRFDCDDDGDWEKTITTSQDKYTAKDLCDYNSTGTHTARVKVEAGEEEATDTADVKVKSCGGKEFKVNLTASPDSGCAPLDNVDLTAHITGYDNDDDIEYTYYFDCEDDDDWDKEITTRDTTYTARNLCDYDDADDYTARVKVESNGQSDEDTVKINTDDCENGEGNLKVEKTVSNLSRGAGYLTSVNARPGDYVSFKISIEAVSDDVENLTLSDVLPDGLVNIRDIEIDGRPNGGDIEDGLDLDDLDEDDEVVVTFTATVDKASSFSYGQTTITNTATARGEGTSDSDEADIIVQRAEVAGITAISTGFGDNPFIDSFIFPLSLAALCIWMAKNRIIQPEQWFDGRKTSYQRFRSSRNLNLKVAILKAKKALRL